MDAEKELCEGQVIQRWSYKFIWTDKHLCPGTMRDLRHDYDQLSAETP